MPPLKNISKPIVLIYKLSYILAIHSEGTTMAKAKILLHPTLLQSPSSIEAFQRRHSLRVVLGSTGPTIIPSIQPRRELAQRAEAGHWGGDAA